MNFSDLSKEITQRKYGIKRGNIKLSIEDWIELNSELTSYPLCDNGRILTEEKQFEFKFMGVPIVFTSSGITAWIRCEYCQTETLPSKRNGYSYCVKCGALV